VRHVRDDEFEPWSRLFRGYADFYSVPTSDTHQRQIWDWIHGRGWVEALVAERLDGAGQAMAEPEGLAHLREWVRPLRGSVCGYLDDLFVLPSARRQGAARALFEEINRLAAARGWAVVRWTTAVDNHDAQALYDLVATRTTWVTYDMTPSA
jgi:GNAT superfamily N-acetyltransferase